MRRTDFDSPLSLWVSHKNGMLPTSLKDRTNLMVYKVRKIVRYLSTSHHAGFPTTTVQQLI